MSRLRIQKQMPKPMMRPEVLWIRSMEKLLLQMKSKER